MASLPASGPVPPLDLAARAADERSGLRRVAAAVVARIDPTEALNLAAAEVAALVGAEQGFVFRLVGDRVEIAGASGLEDSPIGAVWISPVYLGGLGAPVLVGTDLWGVLVAATTRAEAFPEGAEGRLAYFAEIAGIAIGNAEANERLARLAMSDPLTGLANHRAFRDALEAEVERARRHGRPLALAVIDVDHFKAVNDIHGHAERWDGDGRPDGLVGEAIADGARVLAVADGGDLLSRGADGADDDAGTAYDAISALAGSRYCPHAMIHLASALQAGGG